MKNEEIAKRLERVEKELRDLKEEVRQGRQYIPMPYPQPYPVPYIPQPWYPWGPVWVWKDTNPPPIRYWTDINDTTAGDNCTYTSGGTLTS